MRIVWDEPKRISNIDKHGMDFAQLTLNFFENALIGTAKLNRELAIGEFNGQLIIAVVYRVLGSEAVSIISMRPAREDERRRYHG